MTTTGVLAGSVGEGGRNDERDVKLVGSLLDNWWAREAGARGGRAGRPALAAGRLDGTAHPRRDSRPPAWSGLDPNDRVEPGDPTWDALAACHLAGIRSGRARAENWAFVPLRRPGDPSLSEADWRAAFAVWLRRLRERHRTVSSTRTFRDGRAADRADSGRNRRRRSRPARLIRRPVGQNTRGQ